MGIISSRKPGFDSPLHNIVQSFFTAASALWMRLSDMALARKFPRTNDAIISAGSNRGCCSLRSQQPMHRNRKNSDFAHVCLGFITQKQRENTSRRQRVSSNALQAENLCKSPKDFSFYKVSGIINPYARQKAAKRLFQPYAVNTPDIWQHNSGRRCYLCKAEFIHWKVSAP